MYLIYDTETTGLPKNDSAPLTDADNWPRLVQIAWQLHDNAGKLLEAQNFIVKPEGFSIPYNAEKVHGISTQRATDEGKPLADVLEAFAQAVGKTQIIVGHNIVFDLNIVGAEYHRVTQNNILEGKPFLDTKEESTDFVAIAGGRGGKFKWPTLTELHVKLFGEGFEDAHDAAYDVRATARCFFGLLNQKVVKPLDETLPTNIIYEPPILDDANFAKRKQERAGQASGAGEDTGEKIELPEDYIFTHLHLHSQYSLLQSTAGVKNVMKKTKEKGMKAVAVTDLGNLYGAYNATAYGADEGLKVIVGVDVFISDKRTQTQFTKNQSDHRTLALLLAKHKTGFGNLSKLCSLGHIEGMYANYPRVDKDLIQKYSEGLIAIIGGFETEIYNKILEEGEEAGERALQWWMEVFKDDLYLEICRHSLESQDYVNSVLVRLGRKYQVKCVATNNVFYLDKKDAEPHDTLLAVKDGKPKSEPKHFERGLVDYIRGKRRFGFPNDEFYFKSTDEMKRLFADLPEALLATQEIVDKCEPYKLKSPILMPTYDIPAEFETQDDYLRYLTYEGAKKHYSEPFSQEVTDRLDLELTVIKNMGFPGYFLIVQDFINEGRKMGVFVGPGRGCVTADARVVMPNGTTKPLPEVQIGDKVITHDGSLQRVTNTFKYPVKEELLTIKTYYGDVEGITLTKDHKVLAEKQERPANYHKWSLITQKSRKMPEPKGETSWTQAENIEIGDWLFLPTPQVEVKELAYFDLAEFSNGKELRHDDEFVYHDALNPVGKPIHTRMKKAKRYLHLDEDWFTILGLFVGDGWFDSKNTPAVNFIFNKNHTERIDFLKKKALEQGFSISENHTQGATVIDVRSRQLQLLFKKLFCNYEYKPETKHIPDLVLHASEKNALAFLKGYLWADGHQAEHKVRFTTVSRTLADQVRFLCWRLGIPASLGKEEKNKPKEIRKGSGEYFKNLLPSYNITIPKDDRIGEKQATKTCFYKSIKNGILLKVREVGKQESVDFVYDIEVENNANYLTSSFLVHNSAAGSAVAYCTGITNIDPIKYDLLFERFLNPERVSMPDIDIDFDDEGRQSVIDYVIKKYGKNQVAQIITYGTMAARMAIKDVARALELDLPASNQLAKYVPEKPGTKLSDAYLEVQELKEILALTEDPRSKVLQDAKVLEGSIRGTGIHAAGVIIAPKDLLECVPVCTAKDSDLWVTQFDGKVVESAGMLKMDFLGLKTLTIMKDALKIIKKNRGIEIDLDTIPMDDLKTFELYQAGSTIGTFQFESEGMQMYLKQLKPNNIEDLIAMNSLFRPGPLAFIPLYIERKHGREVTEFAHPLLEPLLGRTFGIMVYQEQIMQTAQVLAGYSLGGADLLRRAMGKKDKAEMDRQRETFVKGSKEKNDIPEEKANEIFDIMAKFAEYGFNRSHSAAYSVVAYQTAYLKANYPAEYMASVLSHNMNIEKITFFLEECQKMGVQVLGPDVNDSDLDFSVNEQGQVRFGLAAIKGTGEAAVEGIMEDRAKNGKFKDIFDFVQRLTTKALNKKSLESLAQAGGFDSFEIDRATYFATGQDGAPFIEKLMKYGSSYQKDKENTGASLFGGNTQAQIATPAIPQGQPWGKLERLNREKEVVGFYISGHPLDQFKTAILSFRAVPLSRIGEFDKQEIYVAGIVTAKTIKQGSKGAFTTFMLEDYQSSLEFALFGKDHDTLGETIDVNQILLIKGKVQMSYRGDRYELRINQVQNLEEVKGKHCRGVRLHIDIKQLNSSLISTLHELVLQYTGTTPLHITLFDIEENYSTELTSQRYQVNISDALFSKLDGLKLEYKLVF